MKSEKLYLILILCLLIITPVMAINSTPEAEVKTGTLSTTGYYSQNVYFGSGGQGALNPYMNTLTINSSQNTADLKAIIHWPISCTQNAKPPISAETTFKANLSNVNYGNGKIGVQNYLDEDGDLLSCYMYVVFDNWTGYTLTGNRNFDLIYNNTALNNLNTGISNQNALSLIPTGSGCFSSGGICSAGHYTTNRDVKTSLEYTLTYPDDKLGMGVNLTKTLGISRVLLIRSYDGNVTLGTEFNTENVVSTIVPNAYYISLQDTAFRFSNSSILFPELSSHPYPTATTQPYLTTTTLPTTPPPPNSTIGTIVVELLDASNFTKVNGATVSIHSENDPSKGWFNTTLASNNNYFVVSGYGAGGNTAFINGHTYHVYASKTGYNTYDQLIAFNSNNANGGTMLMVPSIYSTTPTSFVLGIRFISTTTGNIFDPLVGTVTLSNQSSLWNSTITNPQSGRAFFSGLTASHSFKIDMQLDGYQPYTGYFASSSSMGGTTQYYDAFITPSSTATKTYNLTIIPTTGTVNETYNLGITGDLSTAKSVAFRYYSSSSYTYDRWRIGSGYAEYTKIGGTWYQNDGTGYTIVSSLPQSINAKLNEVSTVAGDYTAIVYITSTTDATYQASTSFRVVDSGRIRIRFNVWDGVSSLTQVYPYNIYVNDITNGVWYNRTITSSSLYDGSAWISINSNVIIRYYASATGYYDSSLVSYPLTTTEHVFDINLIPITSIPVGNTTLYVNVRDSSMYMTLPNVRVNVSDGQSGFTNNNGQVSFVVLNGSTYTVRASGLSGYSAAAGTVTTSASYATVYLTLMRLSQTTPPYLNPNASPVGYVTTLPTLSTTLNWTEGESCTIIGANATLLDQIKNYIACNGVRSKEGQNAVLGLLLMVACGAIMGRYGKGMGAVAGVIAGAAVSFYAQLFPFWVLIFVVICAGIVFAAKIFGGGDK